MNTYGPNVFAVLTPCRKKYWANTIQAFSHAQNAIWNDTEPISSREPTPALSQIAESEDQPASQLVVKFEQFNYLQAGTDEEFCNILLKFPGIRAVSARQWIIVVRADYTIFLEDQFSKYGTRVVYDGKEEERKELHGDWILANPPMDPKRWDEVVIFTGNVAYTIEFPNHVAGSSEYLKKLRTFREKASTEVPLFGALDLYSKPTTAAPSEPLSRHGNEGATYVLCGEIARSSFGTVEKILDTRHEKYYIKKTILRYPRAEKAERKRKRNKETEMTAHEAWFKAFRARMAALQIINHVS